MRKDNKGLTAVFLKCSTDHEEIVDLWLFLLTLVPNYKTLYLLNISFNLRKKSE